MAEKKVATTKAATKKPAAAKKNVTGKGSVVKKAAVKVPVAKKSVAEKVKSAPKAPVKKVVVPKAAVKKSAVEKKMAVEKKTGASAAGKKTTASKKRTVSKKAPIRSGLKGAAKMARKPMMRQQPVVKPVPKVKVETEVVPTEVVKRKPRFGRADLDSFKERLLAMRERMTGQSGALRESALERNDEVNPEEDGTDAFMRQQTLHQVSTHNRNIADIDSALRAIDEGTYGVCEMCGVLIGKGRLEAQPFAPNCINCQSELEKMTRGRVR